MNNFKKLNLEECLNTLSHAAGILFGVIGCFVLLKHNVYKTNFSVFSILVYALSFIILFTASTLYHYTVKKTLKQRYRILDHISIYLLIAGTYTPVLLITLINSLGFTLLYLVWGIACFGLVLKLFFTGRFEVFSMLLYLIMGWLIVIDFHNLRLAIGSGGVFWLILGGVFYTIGIVFYAISKIPYNHFIWHLFVLAGAICHFFMILLYVI